MKDKDRIEKFNIEVSDLKRNEQFYCNNRDWDKTDKTCKYQCDMCRYLQTGELQ